MVEPVPSIRLYRLNDRSVRPDGAFVLYWMTAARRLESNFGLQHAAGLARRLGRPLVVLEALRVDYPHASDRLHAFIIQGMAQNAARAAELPLTYYPYLEPATGAGRGLVAALAQRACAVVCDWFPCFFIPAMLRAAAGIDAALTAVDSCGLLPLAAAPRAFPTAYAFRRFLQKELPGHLAEMPQQQCLDGSALPEAELPGPVLKRWPQTTAEALARPRRTAASLPIDHAVPPAALKGGAAVAGALLEEFLEHKLPRYEALRDQPAEDATSGLSPYLHFGHISAHDIFRALARVQGWSPQRLGLKATGKRQGWWGMDQAAEAFADQFITWRELGYVFCHHRPGDYKSYDSLPDWARQSLDGRAADPRPYVYGLDELERARTHSRVWNAAQNQLLGQGVMHNYMRMLWGKKILHWSADPRSALAAMIHLNDRWALDGRDPNSYSGIFWCLGRFDRAWGPRREVFGTVRYMSTKSAQRKLRLGPYLERFAPEPQPAG